MCIRDRYSSFGDGGERVPGVYVLAGPRIIDLSNLASAAQMLDLYAIETQGLDPVDKVVIILVTE